MEPVGKGTTFTLNMEAGTSIDDVSIHFKVINYTAPSTKSDPKKAKPPLISITYSVGIAIGVAVAACTTAILMKRRKHSALSIMPEEVCICEGKEIYRARNRMEPVTYSYKRWLA